MLVDSFASGSLLATVTIGLVTCLFVYWLIKRWKYNLPPSPPGLPLFGNAFQISMTNLHEQAFEWSKKYGPVITVRIGPMPLIIVNKIEPALEVLVTKSTDFAGRMITPSVNELTFGGKDIAFDNYRPSWVFRRSIAAKAIRHYMQGTALETMIHDVVKTVFEEVDAIAGEFDPHDYINFIVGNMLTSLCFGGKYAFKDHEVSEVMDKRDKFIEIYGIGPWEDFIPGLKYVYKTKGFKLLEDFTDDMMNRFIRRKLKLVQSTFNKDNIRHVGDSLLFARLEAEEENPKLVQDELTDDHLVQIIADVFFAGADTLRITLKSVLLHMVAFQDIQNKVQDEIDSVVGKDRLPSLKDRPKLCYSEAVLHESMRLASVIPLGIQRMTLCDTSIGNYKIPKGTMVAVNLWGLHHDPELWEDVHRFKPERFLDEHGQLCLKPKHWLPFSAGLRSCLGEFVAKPNLLLIFVSLLQRYKWKMVEGKCADFTRVGAAFGLSYKPYKVIAERRV